MDNQEAIEKFKKIKKGSIFLIHQRIEGKEVIEDYSLCDMAISALQEQEWIPVSERLPDEDHGLGGSGKQFSDEVLISITREDEDAWCDISQTIDGEWALELPKHCEIAAWKPLPEPYREDIDEDR